MGCSWGWFLFFARFCCFGSFGVSLDVSSCGPWEEVSDEEDCDGDGSDFDDLECCELEEGSDSEQDGGANDCDEVVLGGIFGGSLEVVA